MSADDRTVRVFISSTFRDMNAERDYLVTVVFPELRERLERLGLELFDVDLRWGVPEHDADGEKANSWAYCKRWIDRVEPFFVCILGQRYGWVPPASEIKDAADRAAYAGLSITEMEIRHAVLDGRLQRRSTFYVRLTRVPAVAPADIYARFVDAAEQARLEDLTSRLRSSSRPVRGYAPRWTGTGFDHLDEFGKMVLEDLWSGVLRDRRYVPPAAWQQALGHDPVSDPLYSDELQPVPEKIWAPIVAAARPALRNPLDVEAEAMAAFASTRVRWFQGRQRELMALRQFVAGEVSPEASRLCVVHAPAGQGKTALLARLVQDLAGSPDLLVSHFVGATEHSADPRALVGRLVKELDRQGISHPKSEPVGEDLESLCQRLAARLEDYAGPRRIVLIIDSVNQLQGGHDLNWLPRRLGGQVRVVLSCLDDPAGRVMLALAARRPPPLWIAVEPLALADRREIIRQYFMEYCKELDCSEEEALCALPRAGNPLYLRVVLDELRSLGAEDLRRLARVSEQELSAADDRSVDVHEAVPLLVRRLPEERPDVVSLFDWVLERLEVFGQEEVRMWCTYLALGRAGMGSRELSDLVARRLGPEAAAAALRIERGLRRYLQPRGRLLDFFHGQLREAVERRYLPAEIALYHSDIATYLETRLGDGDIHAMSELPYHQTQAGLVNDYCRILLDYTFLQAKVNALGVESLIADYGLSAGSFPGLSEEKAAEVAVLALVQSALRLSAYALTSDPAQLPAQLTGRLMNRPEGELQMLLAETRQAAVGPWLRPLTPSLTAPGSALVRTLNVGRRHSDDVHGLAVTEDGRWCVTAVAGGAKVWDLATGAQVRTLEGGGNSPWRVALAPDGQLAVIASFKGEISVCDLTTGENLRTWATHDHVVTLAVTPNGRGVLSASEHGALRVWDLSTGEELVGFENAREGSAVGPNFAIDAVAVTPDSRCVVYALGGELMLWDLETGKVPRRLGKHAASIEFLAVTPDCGQVLAQSVDNNLTLWDLATGALLRSTDLQVGGKLRAIAMTPDRWLALCLNGITRSLSLLDATTGAELCELGQSSWASGSAAITRDGRWAVTALQEMGVQVWDVAKGTGACAATGEPDAVIALAVTPDGRLAVSGSAEQGLRVWDLATGAEVRPTREHEGGVDEVAVMPEGRRAVTRSTDNTLEVRAIPSGGKLQSVPLNYGGEPEKGRVTALAVTPDGRLALCGAQYRGLQIWDLETNKHIRTLWGHYDNVTTVALTPDGRSAVSGAVNGEMIVWDLATDKALFSKVKYANPVAALVLTPDGRQVLSACRRGTTIWDVETGGELGSVAGEDIRALAVSPDGRWVASASDSGMVQVWDLDSKTTLVRFDAQLRLTTCAVSPDGLTLVAGDIGGHLHFLRLENVAAGATVLTAWRKNGSGDVPGADAFGCPYCRTWSEIASSALGTKFPCPNCGKPVTLNPFVIEADWSRVARAWQKPVL
jgi:WD40 repeat protein